MYGEVVEPVGFHGGGGDLVEWFALVFFGRLFFGGVVQGCVYVFILVS